MEDLKVIGRLAHIPDAKSAITRGRGEDIGLAGVPDSEVDTVGILVEGADRGRAVEGPMLDRVVPGGERKETRQKEL